MQITYFFSTLINRSKRKVSLALSKRLIPKRPQPIDWKKIRVRLIKISVVFVLVLVSVYLIYPLIISFKSFKIERDSSDQRVLRDITNGSKTSFLLIGIDQRAKTNIFIDSLILVSFDNNTKQVGIFAINPDINVYVTKYQKEFNLRSLFSYSEAEKQEIPFLIEIVENLLAFRIDRYVKFDIESMLKFTNVLTPVTINFDKNLSDPDMSKFTNGKTSWAKGTQMVFPNEFLALMAAGTNGEDIRLNNQAQLVREILDNIISFSSLLKVNQMIANSDVYFKTDLSKTEILNVLNFLRTTSIDRYKIAYTKDISLVKIPTNFGIYPQFEPVLESIDQDISTILLNNDVLKEQAGVEVLNGSGIGGLANSRARWITNSGGRVVHFGNSIEESNETLIYVIDKEKYPATLNELNKVFNNKAKLVREEYKYKHFGDIVVVVGKEYE
ncbi:MAG: LCP family protein [bacterium]